MKVAFLTKQQCFYVTLSFGKLTFNQKVLLIYKQLTFY